MLRDKINEALSSKITFYSDPMGLVSIIVAVLINIIHWVVLLINIPPSGQKILLRFNVIYGADLVAQSFLIYFIPGAALVFLLINIFLSKSFYEKEKITSYFLNFFSIPIQIIFLVASIILININA